MSCEFATLDASYVLGSLAPAERVDYERHLRGCKECSRSVQELAGLPGLLARVPAEVLEPAVDHEPVPTTLLPALVAAVERQQRRRTVRTALLAAAAVAVIAGGSAVVAASLDDDRAPLAIPPAAVETTAAPQRMIPLEDGQSEGWVSLTPTPTGTRVNLTCTYRSSYGGEHDYKLIVSTTNGENTHTKTFTAVTGVEEKVTLPTTIAPDDIEKVLVKGDYGAILLLSP